MARFHDRRLKAVQGQLQDGEALFVNTAPDVFYITGFTGDDSYLFITSDRLYFITDGRYTEQAQKESKVEIRIEDIRGDKRLTVILADIIRDRKTKLLLLDKKNVSLDLADSLRDALGNTELSLKNSTIVKDLRMVKDEIEIETIRQNLILTELGYHYIVRRLEKGMTELEAAAELEFYLKKKGAFRTSFDTIVASGHRSSLPHGAASEKKIEKDDLIMFDFGILKNGYCSDFTRCYNFGKIIIPKIREIHGIVRDALKAAESKIRPGIRAKEVHQAAYDVIKDAGYEFQFLHSTGHGVGIEVHELPNISQNGDVELKEGMVFTVEPGIYLAGIGGIRLEDMVAVRKDGCEVLTTSGYDL